MGWPGGKEELERAEPIEAIAVEAFRGKPYEEIRTRAVEDGWIHPWQVKEPYPYRMPRTPYSSVLLEHEDGTRERREVQWDVVLYEDGRSTLLLHEGDRVFEVNAQGCVAKTHENEIRL